MSNVKVVKINEILNNNNDNNYKKLLHNPSRIKDYIEKKSRKNLELKFKEQFSKKKSKKKLRSRIKFKKIDKKTINNVFKLIEKGEKINNISKFDLLKTFHKIIITKNIGLSNRFINCISRQQLIVILSFLNIINITTKAPTPLLKNILYNCITSSINIVN